jgi:hypothetical protein
MNKKLILVIALIGIGLWALPQTMSLFAGQHTFVNIDATGNQISCIKCHGDVQAELVGQGVNTITGTVAPHAGFECAYCHRIEAGAASGDNAYAIVTYTNGTTLTASGNKNMRTIAISMADFEEENFPTTIVNNVASIVAVETAWGGKFALAYGGGAQAQISPMVAGSETDTTVLTIYNEYEKPLYNTSTNPGTPYDTSARKLEGMILNKMGSDIANWSAYSVKQRYWTPLLIGVGSRVINPGSEYHAASLVSCLECHGGSEPLGHYSRVLDGQATASCEQCHYGSTNRWTELGAGGFGLLGGSDTGEKEAHKEFQMTNDGITRQKSGVSNGACVSCHTHVAVDITYIKPTTYGLTVGFGADGSEAVGGFVVGGSTYTYSPPR